MKKYFLFFLVAITVLSNALARPVDTDRARRVAATFLVSMGHPDVGKLAVVPTPFTHFYLFRADNAGFVLVAADDEVRPILGYSLTGTFSAEHMPPHLFEWFQGYDTEIARIQQLRQDRSNPMHSDFVVREWERLGSGLPLDPQLTTSVGPLLTTTWNQSPRYNYQCPYDSAHGQYVVTGCTATATAQVMKYWNHPTTGYGSHSYEATNEHTSYGMQSVDFGATTYDWAHMPNALTYSSSQTEIDAVAELMYHIGVAVEMEYDYNGSGSATVGNAPSAQSALATYFKYASDMVAVYRSSTDDSTHSAILRAELDRLRPILYTGYGSGGHAFVLDGYDVNNMFHVNWGWGGSCDAYYAIGYLNPASGGIISNSTSSYNNSNVAIIGIRPNPDFGNGGTVTVGKTGGTSSCTVSGGGTYSFGDEVTVGATAESGYRFENWTDHSSTNPRTFVMNGGNYSFTAHFESIGYDVMSYCGNKGNVTSFGYSDEGADKYWGIKLPATALTVGRALTSVEFFATGEGTYDVKVYKGASDPSTEVFATTVQVTADEADSWISVDLPQEYAVESGQSLWLTLHNTDALYPVAVSSSGGCSDGFLWGSAFSPLSYWTDFSVMIRGHFNDAHICGDLTGDTTAVACDRFTWPLNGVTYTSSGNAQFTIRNADNCDSVVTLHLTVFRGSHGFLSTTVCDRYTWHGVEYSTSGDKTYHYVNAIGCPSTDTLHLTVNHSTHNAATVAACDRYYWHGTTYTASGTLTYGYINAAGCSSVDTLHLTVNHSTHGDESAAACENYTWPVNGVTYTRDTTFDYHLPVPNAQGCDSVVTLHLTIPRSTHTHEYVTHCGPYTWPVDGRTYNKSGTKYYKSTTPEGCPLRDTLTLTVVTKWSHHDTVVSCVPYTWDVNGRTYNQSGIKYYKGEAEDGCKVYDTLTLTIGSVVHSHKHVTHCGPYTWEVTGKTYNKSGVKTYKSTADGCKVYDTLTLTIVTAWSNHDTVASCGPYTWAVNGKTYNKSGVKTYKGTAADGCKMYDTLTLTVNAIERNHEYVTSSGPYTWAANGKTYNKSGTKYYKGTTNEGCPRYDTLTLVIASKGSNSQLATHQPPTSISNSQFSTLNALKVYPNPTTGVVHLGFDGNNGSEGILNSQFSTLNSKVELFDIVGRRVARFENTGTIDLSALPNGTYTLRVTLPDGIALRKVVKR